MGSFIARHRPDWEELGRLLAKARRSAASLSPAEIGRLDVLYRRVTVHLAQVVTRTTDAALARHLNDLAAAAHAIIYIPPKKGLFRGVWRFVTEGFARAVVRQWRCHAVAGLLVLLGTSIGFFATQADPLAGLALSQAGESRVPGASQEHLLAVLQHGRNTGSGEKFLFTSFLFTNNFRVGIMAMGLGLLAAVPTVFLMAYNGAVLGAMAAVYHQAGLSYEFGAWILPHGVTEIGAIVLMGGIGLKLGVALMCPGPLSRAESLVRAGREAGYVGLGAAGMLIAAAIIESYLRQSHLSNPARYLFASGSALFWAAYFAHGALRERWSVRAA